MMGNYYMSSTRCARSHAYSHLPHRGRSPVGRQFAQDGSLQTQTFSVNGPAISHSARSQEVGERATASPLMCVGRMYSLFGADRLGSSNDAPKEGPVSLTVASPPLVGVPPPGYIPRAKYLHLKAGSLFPDVQRSSALTLTSDVCASKRRTSFTPITYHMVDPVRVDMHFAHAPSALEACMRAEYPKGALRDFILRCLPFRGDKNATL